MEPTLPVWSIRPNWKGGILERLEWLTDVLASSSGAEQRRALRLSPRRSIEITINPTQNERTFVDLLLHKLGSNDWLFPIWFDKGKLSASVALGDERVEFDNTYREHGVGGLALLYKDAWTWEVISISGQDDEGLDLDVPLDAAWPKGTAVYPLRQARLQNETELNALSSRVGESVLLWTMVEANEWPAVMPADQSFEGMPVLTIAPNRSATLTVNHTRLSTDRDNQVGIPHRVDSAGRAFQVQSHSWMRHGRQQQAEFRSMLYWFRGRQRAVWLPSFNEDVVTSRASALASLNLDVQKIGMAYAGGVIPGRDVVRVNGTPARITALGAPQTPQEERLRIGAGLTAAIPVGARGSFMSPARLNQDAIEILHHADSDGAMECSTTFKSFSNTRATGGDIYFPIPATEMNDGPCGFSFQLINPSFESGNMTGWTITNGGFNVIPSLTQGPNTTLPHSGSYFAIGTSGFCAFYQEVMIPARFNTQVDSGIATFANFAAYQNSGVPLGSSNDRGRLYVSFRSITDVELLRVYSPWNSNFEWVRMNVPATVVPPGTRKIRVGTENEPEDAVTDSMWDSFDQPVLVFGA